MAYHCNSYFNVICHISFFFFVFCLNSSRVCETKLIVQKSMLILSYSDECGNDNNLTSGTQYHQKNGFRNLELLIGVGYIFKFFPKHWFGQKG